MFYVLDGFVLFIESDDVKYDRIVILWVFLYFLELSYGGGEV